MEQLHEPVQDSKLVIPRVTRTSVAPSFPLRPPSLSPARCILPFSYQSLLPFPAFYTIYPRFAIPELFPILCATRATVSSLPRFPASRDLSANFSHRGYNSARARTFHRHLATLESPRETRESLKLDAFAAR